MGSPDPYKGISKETLKCFTYKIVVDLELT